MRYLLLLILFMYGCKEKTIQCYNVTSGEILSKYPNRVFIPKGGGNKIVQIIDKGTDSTKGGLYAFNEYSCLRKYIFFQNLQTYTYREDYNQKGQIIKRVGKIFLNTVVKTFHEDSVFIKIYLFGLMKNYQYLKAKINNEEESKLRINDDTLYTNMKIATLGINLKDLKKIFITFSTRYEDERSEQIKDEYDTLSLVKNPKLNFDPTVKYAMPVIVN